MGDEVKVKRKDLNLSCCFCCKISGWIRLITWTKIIIYALVILTALLNSMTLEQIRPTWLTKKYCNALQQWTMISLWALLNLPTPLILLSVVQVVDLIPQIQNEAKWKYGQQFNALAVFGLAIFLLLLGIAMSIVLLKGITQKSLKKIKVWIVYAIICMTLTVLEAAAGIVLENLGIHYDPHRLIIRVMLSMTFQGCVLGTVLKFKNQLEDQLVGTTTTTAALLVPTAGISNLGINIILFSINLVQY